MENGLHSLFITHGCYFCVCLLLFPFEARLHHGGQLCIRWICQILRENGCLTFCLLNSALPHVVNCHIRIAIMMDGISILRHFKNKTHLKTEAYKLKWRLQNTITMCPVAFIRLHGFNDLKGDASHTVYSSYGQQSLSEFSLETLDNFSAIMFCTKHICCCTSVA